MAEQQHHRSQQLRLQLPGRVRQQQHLKAERLNQSDHVLAPARRPAHRRVQPRREAAAAARLAAPAAASRAADAEADAEADIDAVPVIKP